MTEIVLTTLNARYSHCAFGLRYLMANLGELQSRAKILEFNIRQSTEDVAEAILREEPKIVGIGVYIWNALQSTQLVADLKRLRPGIIVILGGPEVSYETEQQEIALLADYVITGEADIAFAELCSEILKIVGQPPRLPSSVALAAGDAPALQSETAKIITAPPPTFEQLVLPYDLYTDEDVAHRVIYVEASRGCPFECEFCLSSLDIPVRAAPLEPFFTAMQKLLERGVRHFKFADRTFNLNVNHCRAILEFFLERQHSGLFLHFEMIPDHLPESLREVIGRFPRGALQFEVGVQTFNESVAARISRRQDNAKVEANLRWLREQTGVYVHADLVAGLPGEDVASFATGFDRLVALRPHEIQIELLKRLRGAPISRHDTEWGMVYSPHPPYEILQTKLVDSVTMQRLRRFARYWDLVANSGNFVETTPSIWRNISPFAGFMRFGDWVFLQLGRVHGIALSELTEMVFRYLTEELGGSRAEIAESLIRDYQRGGHNDLPVFLREYAATSDKRVATNNQQKPPLARQARHLGAP